MTDQTEKKERAKKPKMDLTKAVDANGNPIELDEKGRLSGIPANWTPNVRKLARASFVDKGHFFEWQAQLAEADIARLQERIKELHEQATEARQGPDPTTKATRKLQKMMKMAAELKAQLSAEGVDLSTLGLED